MPGSTAAKSRPGSEWQTAHGGGSSPRRERRRGLPAPAAWRVPLAVRRQKSLLPLAAHRRKADIADLPQLGGGAARVVLRHSLQEAFSVQGEAFDAAAVDGMKGPGHRHAHIVIARRRHVGDDITSPDAAAYLRIAADRSRRVRDVALAGEPARRPARRVDFVDFELDSGICQLELNLKGNVVDVRDAVATQVDRALLT